MPDKAPLDLEETEDGDYEVVEDWIWNFG
jgi:hypothetical protein